MANKAFHLLLLVFIGFLLIDQSDQIKYPVFTGHADESSITSIDYELVDTVHLTVRTTVPDKDYAVAIVHPPVKPNVDKSVFIDRQIHLYDYYTGSDGFLIVRKSQSNYLS